MVLLEFTGRTVALVAKSLPEGEGLINAREAGKRANDKDHEEPQNLWCRRIEPK